VSKSNATEADILAKVFLATALPWDAATDLDIHLHTGDPGEGGISTTNECTYTSYAVVTVSRSATGWTLTGSAINNDGLLQFPQCTGGSNTATHVSVTPAGSTQILYSGPLDDNLAISNGIVPQFAINALTITED
jgi:hypothetical protein